MRSSIFYSHESGSINTNLFGAYARRREIIALEHLHLEISRVRSKSIEFHCKDPCRVVPVQPVQPPLTSPHPSLSTTVKAVIAHDCRQQRRNMAILLLESLDALFNRTSLPPRRPAQRSHQSYHPQPLRSSTFCYDSLLRLSLSYLYQTVARATSLNC